MVELRVDVSEDQLPDDCYMSVRVGEVQKLSRIAPSRSYQFPKAGERRYGKIEIYRRIGTVGVDVDPMNAGERQVCVGCGDLGAIKLKVVVNEDKKMVQQAAVPPTPSKNADESSKSKAAKEYLRQHSLELQLSEAMQAVLRLRPENPIQFLAETLLKNLSQGAVALPPEPLKAKLQPQELAAPVARSPPKVDLTNFSGYFTANFGTAPKAAWDKIYSKFPARAPAAAAAAAKAAAGPSSIEALKTKVTADLLDAMRKGELQRALKKTAFVAPAPFELRPSVGSWLVKRSSPVKAIPSKAQVFARLPSVGTWLVRLADEEKVALLMEVKAQTPDVRAFQMLPSVGTWLAFRNPTESTPKAQPQMGPPSVNYPYPASKPHCVSSAVFNPQLMNLGIAPRMLFI